MKHYSYNADRICVRTALALTGAAIIAVGATAPEAAAQATLRWQAREFQGSFQGIDIAVDIAYWQEDATHEWVYVTGYQTLANGATVFATHKYDANFSGQGENEPVPSAFYPLLTANPTGVNRAVAIEVDPENGDVYVTGESVDPTGADGFDYVTIKYDKFLDPHTDWITAGHQDAVVRWDNPAVGGPISSDRPVALALGTSTIHGKIADNVIGITGTSYAGLANGDDIVTLLLETATGNAFTGWTGGVQSFDGSAHADDRPVGLDVHWNGGSMGIQVLNIVVAGTTKSLNLAQINDDIWTIEYNSDGSVRWQEVYNGPINGDDVATAVTLGSNGGVFVSGYTPHFVAGLGGSPGGGSRAAAPETPDTDYIVLGYEDGTGGAWFLWPDTFNLPNVKGVRVFNGPGPASNASDDRAMDVVVDDLGNTIWLTGFVREADGDGYDTATIGYSELNTTGVPELKFTDNLPSTTEKGIALATNNADVYVTSSIDIVGFGSPLIMTFKIDENRMSYTRDWTKLFSANVTDVPFAIIAPTAADFTVPVFVVGRSFLGATSHDQISLRYDQP